MDIEYVDSSSDESAEDNMIVDDAKPKPKQSSTPMLQPFVNRNMILPAIKKPKMIIRDDEYFRNLKSLHL